MVEMNTINPAVKRAIIEATNMLGDGLPVDQGRVSIAVCKRFEWPPTKVDTVKRYIRFLIQRGLLKHPLNDNTRIFVDRHSAPVFSKETRLTDFVGGNL